MAGPDSVQRMLREQNGVLRLSQRPRQNRTEPDRIAGRREPARAAPVEQLGEPAEVAGDDCWGSLGLCWVLLWGWCCSP